MKLVNRVSAFFLTALALALVSYSAVFYFLVRDYLYQQFDADLHSSLEILSASVEVEPDDAKWHPAEHGIDLSQDILNDVIWIVCDERDQVVDRSRNVRSADDAFAAITRYARSAQPENVYPVELGQFRVLQRELAAPAPKPLGEREPHEFARLRITVARSRADLTAAMNRLAILVCILPGAVWLAAAAIGRWFVRRALEPVREMAQRARSMMKPDFGLRLPTGDSHDELSELAAAFNQLLDQLQAAFDRQRRFSGDAAHQLRNPLAVLQGQLDVARRRPRPTEEYQQTLAVLSDQAAELGQVVESLLFLARPEEETAPPRHEVVQLSDWLPHYAQRWAEHARRGDLCLEADYDARVSVSPALLSQLLDNLVSNAFKYSQIGTNVTIRARRQRERVTVSVADRGIGISPEDRHAIFEPFFRSAQARQMGIAGTGLGLSVAARIAAAMGGELRCDGAPDQGSAFTLSLPAIDGREDGTTVQPSSLQKSKNAG
jgi:heavy metal sensor kinase